MKANLQPFVFYYKEKYFGGGGGEGGEGKHTK